MALQQELLILTFSSSLQLSFLFSSKFQNSGDFEIKNCSSQSIGIETSKVFGGTPCSAARRAGLKRAKLGLKCILK
jgi:hypothetical protein